ncbi:MAG: hypothetical protein LBJ73_03175 [Rickettsiales bacterium]|jgi:hypothetical protein|nr:hypothetical protein [Rickettsiales bacterium]
MKKSTIVLALFVWAFAVQGAFADVDGEDDRGYYKISGFNDTEPETDYDNGIYTTYNTGAQYLSSNTYKGQTNSFNNYVVYSDLNSYLMQSVCASSGPTSTNTSCSITTNKSSSILGSNEMHCWCRLKKENGYLAYDGWVFSGSFTPASYCARSCAGHCALNANSENSALRSKLLAPFEQ